MKKKNKKLLMIIGVISLLILAIFIFKSPSFFTITFSSGEYGTADYYCDYEENLCTFNVNYYRHGTFMEPDIRIYYTNYDNPEDPNFLVITSQENCDKIGGTYNPSLGRCYIVNVLNQQINNIDYGTTSWKITKFEDPGTAFTNIYINGESLSAVGKFTIPLYEPPTPNCNINNCKDVLLEKVCDGNKLMQKSEINICVSDACSNIGYGYDLIEECKRCTPQQGTSEAKCSNADYTGLIILGIFVLIIGGLTFFYIKSKRR